jgi:hypothetical protein
MRRRLISTPRSSPFRVATALVIAAFVVSAAGAVEPTSKPDSREPDAIEWWSVDNGGSVSTGGAWQLTSTIGQPDAGDLAGGAFVLEGGFEIRRPAAGPSVFSDGFESGGTGAWSSVTP